MRPIDRLVTTCTKPVLRVAARRALVGRCRNPSDPSRGRFSQLDADRLLEASWARFVKLVPDVPNPAATGNRLNLLLAALTFVFTQSLIAEGVDRRLAIELTSDAAWVIYRQWGKIPNLAAHLVRGTPLDRLRWRIDAFLRFPFSPPGYRVERLDETDTVAFNVLACPVASWFRDQGAADVCVGSWCDLDFALAEQWDARLERSTTLAACDAACDFRFRLAEERDAHDARELTTAFES